MTVNKNIRLNSDSGLWVSNVRAFTDPDTPSNVTSATASGRIYDKQKVRAVTTEVDGDGATPAVVPVSSSEPFLVGDAVDMMLDDGLHHETTVASKDDDLNELTLNDVVPAGKKVREGVLVKRKLGSTIAMAAYGSPANNYAGGVADTHEGLYLGRKVLCTIDVDDGVGRRAHFSFEAQVVRG